MPRNGLPTAMWAKQVTMALDRAGQVYSFSMPSGKDQFGQPMQVDQTGLGSGDTVVNITGIYHEESRWTQSNVSEEEGSNVSRYRTESYILCEKAVVAGLKWGMTVVVSNKTYRLIRARDIEALDLFCDLVLEEVEPHGLSNPV